MGKFHEVTPTSPKVIGIYTLNLSHILNVYLKIF